jgi:hypothetical protein
MKAFAIGQTLKDDLSPYAHCELTGFFFKHLWIRIKVSHQDLAYNRVTTHRFETFDELCRRLVILEMLQNKHDQIVVFQFAKVLHH